MIVASIFLLSQGLISLFRLVRYSLTIYFTVICFLKSKTSSNKYQWG
jgi:hypothetical protein